MDFSCTYGFFVYLWIFRVLFICSCFFVLRFKLNQYTSTGDVKTAINSTKYTAGKTHTWEALSMASSQVFTVSGGDRRNFPNVAVVVTDGASQDHVRTIQEAVKLRVNGVTILTVAIGNWLNEEEIAGITTDPDSKNIYRARRYTDLNGLVDTIKTAVCNGESQIQCQQFFWLEFCSSSLFLPYIG